MVWMVFRVTAKTKLDVKNKWPFISHRILLYSLCIISLDQFNWFGVVVAVVAVTLVAASVPIWFNQHSYLQMESAATSCISSLNPLSKRSEKTKSGTDNFAKCHLPFVSLLMRSCKE